MSTLIYFNGFASLASDIPCLKVVKEHVVEKSSQASALPDQLMDYATSSWMAQGLHVAAELKLADLLADGPKTSAQLASETGTHAPSLHRLLRALTTIDICKERQDDAFEITALGCLLKSDHPQSLRCWIIWWGTNLWQTWGNLSYSIKSGESARKLLTGTEGFNHLAADPQSAAVFNQALAELTRLTADSIVKCYDFSSLKSVVDVGGGYGQLLTSILRSHSQLSGILFDLPSTIDGAIERLAAQGLAGRCQFVAGDFFESVPAGADAYVIKSVLHDWNDQKSKLILENCRRVMSDQARLLLIERMLPDRLENLPQHQAVVRIDLTMLVAHGAKERTETEFRVLLQSADLQVTRVVPVSGSFSLIEAVPCAHGSS